MLDFVACINPFPACMMAPFCGELWCARLQVVASNALMHHNTNYWRCMAAPAPEGVVWQNLG